jgi:DNA-binding NtrC family response regulator
MLQDGILNVKHDRPGAFASRRNPFFTTLVVDSDSSMDRFLEEFFRSEGHFILRAATAAEALARTREYLPDLILLDNELAGTGGLALMPELLMEHSTAAVLVMAKRPSVSEAVESMKLGAADYLERPLDPARLKQAVDLQKALFKPQ